jgi:hypothetical protein
VSRQISIGAAAGVLGLSALMLAATGSATDEVAAPASATAAVNSIQKVPTPPIVVASGTLLQVELAANVDSKVARVGDRVEGRLAQDVAVGDRRAAVAGAVVSGKVTGLVPGAHGIAGAPTLELTFDSLQAANGATIPIVARYHHPGDDDTVARAVGADSRLRAGTVITVPMATSFSIY